MKKIIFFSTFFIVMGYISFRTSFAFFSSAATSTSNMFATVSTFPVRSGSVVINEIMWMGSIASGSADEWIELKNTTGNTIDLSNWKVDGLGAGTGSITIPSGKSITPHGYFVIANNHEAFSILNFEADYVTSSISLDNNGEQLVLKDNLNNVIDTANQAGAWFKGVKGSIEVASKSMERNNPPGDGTIGTNWHNATTQANLDIGVTEFATPKAPNVP